MTGRGDQHERKPFKHALRYLRTEVVGLAAEQLAA